MLKTILLALVAAIAALLIYAASKPNTFRYQRSIRIHAAPEKIMPYLVNPNMATAWTPWEKKDLNMRQTFSGPESGVGSVMEWEGNREVGQGRAEIIAVETNKVVMKIDFQKPMKAINEAEYLLTPQGDETEMTWSMYGPQPFIAKVIGTVMNCEKMVGKEFEAGLANLKTLVEKQ